MCDAGALHVSDPHAGLHLRGSVSGRAGSALHSEESAPRVAALRLRLLHIPPGTACTCCGRAPGGSPPAAWL